MKKIAISHLKVKEIMSSQIICVSPTMTLRDTIKLFLDKKISGAPLIHQDTGVLLSVVSEADLMKLAAVGSLDEILLLSLDKLPEIQKIIFVKSEDAFAEVFKRFLLNPVRRVIVVDDHMKPIGIVSRRDIIRSFLEHEDQ